MLDAGTDYVAVSNRTVTFTDRGLVTTPVTLCDNSVYEKSETVLLELSGASAGVVLKRSQATLTIVDNEAKPKLAIFDTSAIEGSPVSFTVALSGASSQSVTASFATVANGSATAAAACGPGIDYVSRPER